MHDFSHSKYMATSVKPKLYECLLTFIHINICMHKNTRKTTRIDWSRLKVNVDKEFFYTKQ